MSLVTLRTKGRSTLLGMPLTHREIEVLSACACGLCNSGKRIDAAALIKAIRDLIPAGIGGFIVMENIRVRAMAGHAFSHKSETSLVLSRGVVQAVADIARIPVRTVEPQVWKRWYGLGKEKGEALEVARRLYPCAEHMLKRQKDHNRAEALLMAHWGRKELA